MATVTLQGKPVHTMGTMPRKGALAPDFTLVRDDLFDETLSDQRGKRVILNIFPSIDTRVCAQSVREFNKHASSLDDTVVYNISKDLPFAQKRFCGSEGLEDVVNLSAYRDNDFEQDYGVGLIDGPFKGLLARAVLVLNEQGIVLHQQLINEISDEPDYEAAIASLN